MGLADSYNQFWSNTKPMSTQQWAGGSLSMGPQGESATYTDPSGGQMNFNPNTPLSSLYGNPYIADTWNNKWGAQGLSDAGISQSSGNNNMTPSGLTGGQFNIPMNLFPSSQSRQSSSSRQSSHSGINWDTDLAKGLLDQLISTGQGLPGLANQMGDTLQNQYSNLMDRAMNADNFQGTLNDLARKGMLNSTVAGNTMAGTSSNLAKMVSDRAYDSRLNQLNAQMQVPGLIADLIGLAQESSSQSSSSSSASSSQSNPLAPFELMAQLMAN